MSGRPASRTARGNNRRLQIATTVAAAAAAFDTASKLLVVESSAIRQLPFVYLVNNPSYLLGIAGGRSLLLGLLSLATAVLAGWWMLPLARRSTGAAVAAGLLIGGAASNAADRIFHGQVVDFLDLGWIIVNAADLIIVVGVLISVRYWRALTPSGRFRILQTPDLRRTDA